MRVDDESIPIGPHAIIKAPFCADYLPAQDSATAFRNFGNGTAHPVARTLFTNLRQYLRPAKLAILDGTFYAWYNRIEEQFHSIDFGQSLGPMRFSPTKQASYRPDLACPYQASVGQVIDSGHEPFDFRHTVGYSFFPGLAIPDGWQGIPQWKIGEQTYLPMQANAGTYTIGSNHITVSSLMSVNNNNENGCEPEGRYEQAGWCEVDLTDGRDNDDEGLQYRFPLYRNRWGEDDSAPLDCGGNDPPNPPTIYTVEVLIRIGFAAFRTLS